MKKIVMSVFLVLAFCKAAFSLEYVGDVSLSVSEEYNDNILLVGSDPMDDFITYVAPGIGVSLRSQSSQIRLDYSPTFSFYSSHSDLNETAHSLAATATFALSSKASASVRDTFVKSSETDALSEITDIGPITRRVERRYHTFNTALTYRLAPHVNGVAGISYSDLDYAEPDLSEVKTLGGNVRLEYRLSDTLSLFANGTILKYDYRPDSDALVQEYTAGLTYRYNPRFSITLTGGPTITKIEETGETDTGYGGGISLTRTDERGTATLSLAQSVVSGVESGEPLRSRSAALSVTRDISARWNISFSASYNEYETIDTDTTDANTIAVGGGITYRISSFANMNVNYRYSDYEDNSVGANSYQNHIVILRLNLAYSQRL